MKVLHFGDLHIWRFGLDVTDPFYPKRWLGSVNLALRRCKKFPPVLGETVMTRIEASDADVVIFSGDASTLSQPGEFRRAADLFQPIREKWGERLFAIPGNHDRYTPKTVRARRFETFFPYATLDTVRSQDLGDGLVVVAFDVCIPCKVRSNGRISTERAEQLDAELAKYVDKSVILVGHYPYAVPPGVEESWEHKLLDAERLAAVIAKHQPTAYLHGHKHVRWALREPDTESTLCLNCGSAGMRSSSTAKQAGFLTFEIDATTGVTNPTAVHYDEAAGAFLETPLETQLGTITL